MKNLFLLFAVAFVLGGCNVSYDKTKSGLRFKIIKGKGGEKLKAGDIIKYNQVALIPERDTVLFTTYGKMAGYMQVDTGMRVLYSPMEILPMMSIGDSAVVIMSVDSLMSKGMLSTGYNDVFRRGGQITFRMRVIKKFANEKEANEEAEKDVAAEKARMNKESEQLVKDQRKELEEYLKKNNIKTVTTPSGAYVEVKQQGAGIADTSMDITVIYTGKLFKGGTTFDTNVGSNTGLKFSVGANTTAKGFDEAMLLLGKGGKANVYIPSDLGYGPRGSGDGRIPENAILLFEIEVVDLEKRTGGKMPYPAQVDLAVKVKKN